MEERAPAPFSRTEFSGDIEDKLEKVFQHFESRMYKNLQTLIMQIFDRQADEGAQAPRTRNVAILTDTAAPAEVFQMEIMV